MSSQVPWDNTTLFADDDPADRAFRHEVRDLDRAKPSGGALQPVRPHRSAGAQAVAPQALRARLDRAALAEGTRRHGRNAHTADHPVRGDQPRRRAHALSARPQLHRPLIIDAGTAEQKARHLPPILTGEITWCQGYSESGAGSDLASLTTRAELDGDDFVVNGHKMWTTNGHFADWMFALVRTDPKAQPRHAGISMLLIDLKSPGITVRPIQTIKGDAEFAEEFFVDVRVPRENLLGALNDGWKVANRLLGSERFTTGHPRNAAVLLNRARQVAELTGAIREAAFLQKLAALEIDLLAFSAYYRHAAALHGEKRAPFSMAPVIKIVGGELGQRASELLVDAAERYGPLVEDMTIGNHVVNPAADMFEMRRVTVGSGAVEIQRNIIAKRVLGLPS